MPLKKKIDFNSKIKKLKKNHLAPLANEIKDTIKRRTQSGKDINGKAFKPYSPSYKEYRIEKGRSAKPNLTDSSNMLNAIDWDKLKGGNIGIKMKFNSEEQTAKAIGNQKLRPFFGLSRTDMAYFKKQLAKIIFNEIK